MIIDIHVHQPVADAPDQAFLDAWQAMWEAGRRAGIDRQVLLAWGGANCNDLTAELVARFPDRVIGFARGWMADPTSPATIEHYVRDHGFKGVKLHDEPGLPLNALLAAHPIYLKAAELGIPVLIHGFHEEEGLSADLHNELAGGTAHYPVSTMRELGKRYPRTTFVFAHAGMLWDKAIQAVAPYANLYLDVSGFDPERGIVEKAVAVLGAERVLFGSDAPGRSYAAQIAKVRYADISERERALVLGGNAARLLGLR